MSLWRRMTDGTILAPASVRQQEIVRTGWGCIRRCRPPKDIVDKLNREIVAIMKEPETAKRFADQGAEVVTDTPEEFGRFVQVELARWSKFIQAAKITAD